MRRISLHQYAPVGRNSYPAFEKHRTLKCDKHAVGVYRTRAQYESYTVAFHRSRLGSLHHYRRRAIKHTVTAVDQFPAVQRFPGNGDPKLRHILQLTQVLQEWIGIVRGGIAEGKSIGLSMEPDRCCQHKDS